MKFFRQRDKRKSTIDAVLMEADGTASLLLGNEPPMALADLQQRIDNCVSYALDGQMTRDYPETAGHAVRIILVVANEPTGDLATFVEAIPSPLAAHGVDFRLEVSP